MYEAHFGLAELPFHIAPDPRFYFDSPTHRAAIDGLREGIADGDEFLLLEGDFGAGKTSVARRLLDELDPGRYYTGWLSGQRVEGDDLLASIASTLVVHEFDAGHPLASLMRALEGRGAAGREAVLVLDEAHRLGTESLRRLRKLTAVRSDDRPVLHVVLACRVPPEGIEELRRAGRALRIGHGVVVRALDEAGTRDYLRMRLERAGWQGAPLFDDAAAAQIHACCEGNPGRINRLCGHVLLQLYLQGRTDASADFVRTVDALQQSELDGELPAALPGQEAPEPTPATETMPAIRVPTALPDPVSPVSPTPSMFAAAPEPIDVLDFTPRSEQFPDATPAGAPAFDVSDPPRSAPRPRRFLLRGVAAIVLFVSGGFAWEALSSHLGRNAHPGPSEEPATPRAEPGSARAPTDACDPARAGPGACPGT